MQRNPEFKIRKQKYLIFMIKVSNGDNCDKSKRIKKLNFHDFINLFLSELRIFWKSESFNLRISF